MANAVRWRGGIEIPFLPFLYGPRPALLTSPHRLHLHVRTELNTGSFMDAILATKKVVDDNCKANNIKPEFLRLGTSSSLVVKKPGEPMHAAKEAAHSPLKRAETSRGFGIGRQGSARVRNAREERLSKLQSGVGQGIARVGQFNPLGKLLGATDAILAVIAPSKAAESSTSSRKSTTSRNTPTVVEATPQPLAPAATTSLSVADPAEVSASSGSPRLSAEEVPVTAAATFGAPSAGAIPVKAVSVPKLDQPRLAPAEVKAVEAPKPDQPLAAAETPRPVSVEETPGTSAPAAAVGARAAARASASLESAVTNASAEESGAWPELPPSERGSANV